MKLYSYAFILIGLCLGVLIPKSVLSATGNIDSIQIIIDKQALVIPGESFDIGIITYLNNGKTKKTKGLLKGSSFWLNYKIEVSAGSFSNGHVMVPSSLFADSNKYIEIKAFPKKQPELAKYLRVSLNYETRITYTPTTDFEKIPGSEIKGKLLVQYNNGLTRSITNLNKSKESENYYFEPHGGIWKKGKFVINTDIRTIEAHTATLIITSKQNYMVADTFSAYLDYRAKYKYSLAGSSGSFGSSGLTGGNGSTGYHGGHGQKGQDGEYGQNGPDIGVWADLYYDSILQTHLLYVYAENLWTGEETRFLLNPAGSTLTIKSQGGSGGSGGDGGDGGNGGNGIDGEYKKEIRIEKKIVPHYEKRKIIKKEKKKIINSEGKEVEIEVDVEVEEDVLVNKEVETEIEVLVQGPGQDGGNGGFGGPAGFGGYGGDGGNITLYLTEDASPFRNLFITESNGGSGGKHGNGGKGGYGGMGGSGNPNGRSGLTGPDGPYSSGWAEGGATGRIKILATEEFFSYSQKKE